MDLEVFERKYKYAKDDSADLKALIRRSENRNFEEELEQAKEALGKNKTNLQERTAICDELKSATDTKTLELEGVNERIDSIPENIIDILDTRQEKEQLLSSIATASRHKEECRIKISETKETLLELETFLGDFDIEDLNARQNEVDEKSRNLEETIRAAKHLQRDYNSKSTKLQLLDVVPCGDQFPKCRFIKDAHSVKEEVPLLQIEILEKIAGAKELKEYIASLDPDQITHHINKYTQALDSYSSLGGFLKDTQLLYERSNTSILETTNILNTLETDIATYEDNKGAIENFECLLRLRQTTQDEIVQLKEQCETCNNIVLELYKNTGSLEQQLAMIKSQKKDYQNIQQEYAAYDLYLQCMHSNGIAYDIIKKQLPIINEEVAKVLANIVSFEVFFEDDGRRLNIFIKHPKHEPRPLGMGSGAEKTIASMAIRLALLSVSSLPKGDIFILDEPGTSLDADNMEGFIRILDLIKTYFKTVVLISHLDSLKDCVDTQIVIETRDNYANVEL